MRLGNLGVSGMNRHKINEPTEVGRFKGCFVGVDVQTNRRLKSGRLFILA